MSQIQENPTLVMWVDFFLIEYILQNFLGAINILLGETLFPFGYEYDVSQSMIWEVKKIIELSIHQPSSCWVYLSVHNSSLCQSVIEAHDYIF